MADSIPIDDCWNRIGVWGGKTCPELEKHIHCRNCPVYSAAATQLLDGDLPPGYLDDWTAHVGRERRIEEVETDSVVIFRIGAEWLALPTRVFSEVSEIKTIHSLPHLRRGSVLGLVNIRGELLICVSLSEALGLEAESNPKTASHHAIHRRLLVVRSEGARLVFPVDEVYGIHRFGPKGVKAAPATLAKAVAKYTKGILTCQDKLAGWLDDELLFYSLNKGLS